MGMLTASLIWFAFILTQVLTNDLFSLRPAGLPFINAGSVFVATLAGGAMIGAWKKVAKVVARVRLRLPARGSPPRRQWHSSAARAAAPARAGP
jgi:hypothetical protein